VIAPWTLSEVARLTGGELRGVDRAVPCVAIDGRALPPGALFVAIRGERHDGHRFAAQAVQAGAAAAMVERSALAAGTQLPAGLALVVVEDTRVALGRLAGGRRRSLRGPLVAITASNGKTTMKEMTAAILRAEARLRAPAGERVAPAVLATEGNLNNEIGVPLTLLRIEPSHRFAVVEMGMNHAGEIARLTRIAEPDVAVIGNAGVAHIENLGSREAIAVAKGEILEGLRPGGTAVLNAEDRHIALWRRLAGAHAVVDFAIGRPAAVGADCRFDATGTEVALHAASGEARLRLPVPGEHNARNALAAAAAAMACGAGLDAVVAGLQDFTPVHGRLQPLSARHGASLLDDSYNANPDSARAAIDVLAALPGRRVLVLGDMGELGPQAPTMHAAVGAHARASGVDALLATGRQARHAVEAFGAGATHHETLDSLVEALEPWLQPQTTLLVKGSRFMRMERVVERLRAEARAPATTH
jgi:UDP-N-acetylmuramoyl-tripeptide--D-alanyl-D-alanine ligase